VALDIARYRDTAGYQGQGWILEIQAGYRYVKCRRDIPKIHATGEGESFELKCMILLF